jgi:hypothetical protein
MKIILKYTLLFILCSIDFGCTPQRIRLKMMDDDEVMKLLEKSPSDNENEDINI